jgi:hypothetical protein
MSKKRFVCLLAACPAFALLGAACGDSDVAMAPIASSDASAAAGSGGLPAAVGGAAGQQGEQTAHNAGGAGAGAGAGAGGASAGAASAGAAGQLDAPRDAGALGLAPVQLGDAGNYAVLAQSAISNVPTSAITGKLGLSPAAASYITGFVLTRAGEMWTSPEIVGGAFAADNDPNTPANLTSAVADMGAAYDDAAGRPTPGFVNLGDGAIGGRTLAPGLYNWTSAVSIPADVTLAGGSSDVWIFQIAGDLTMDAAQRMTLSGGAQAKNIVWQVAGEVDIGSASHAEGIVLSKTAIHMGTGASINGRLLAQTAVTLASTTVTEPAP